jgi:hypothetical protein
MRVFFLARQGEARQGEAWSLAYKLYGHRPRRIKMTKMIEVTLIILALAALISIWKF